jgi:endonuclease/exonuclease/phosphatase family metal-dependent hydrolase
MGDFNLIRIEEDRNRPGGNSHNMMLFNSLIQVHDLEEIPLKGRTYTWSNMQISPLLEKLDWIFTSSSWTTELPNTMASPLARLGSDHVPILIQVNTTIPKSNIFRFEFWLEFDSFKGIVEENA